MRAPGSESPLTTVADPWAVSDHTSQEDAQAVYDRLVMRCEGITLHEAQLDLPEDQRMQEFPP